MVLRSITKLILETWKIIRRKRTNKNSNKKQLFILEKISTSIKSYILGVLCLFVCFNHFEVSYTLVCAFNLMRISYVFVNSLYFHIHTEKKKNIQQINIELNNQIESKPFRSMVNHTFSLCLSDFIVLACLCIFSLFAFFFFVKNENIFHLAISIFKFLSYNYNFESVIFITYIGFTPFIWKKASNHCPFSQTGCKLTLNFQIISLFMDLPISTFENNFIIKTFKAKFSRLQSRRKNNIMIMEANIAQPQFTHHVQSWQDFGLSLLNFANLGDDENEGCITA